MLTVRAFQPLTRGNVQSKVSLFFGVDKAGRAALLHDLEIRSVILRIRHRVDTQQKPITQAIANDSECLSIGGNAESAALSIGVYEEFLQ